MTLEEQALELLVKQIAVIYDNKISNLSFDVTYTGIVEKISGNNTYLVNYNGAKRTFKTRNKLSVNVGSVVHVVHPQNHINAKFLLEDILASTSTGGSGGTTSGAVTSVNGLTGVVNLDSYYYRKSEINQMLENVQNFEVMTNDDIDAMFK